MSNFNQAGLSDFGNTAPDPRFDRPTRLSALAISSLVTGVVSLIGCCVPALGVLPVVLGVIAIIVVQRSRGALSGRGLAVGGLVLGLLSLLVSTGIWIGISMGAGSIGPVYSQAFSDDPAVVRSVLTSSASSELTDERIAEFQSRLESDVGGTVTIPKGLGPLWNGYASADPQDMEQASGAGEPNVWPLPAATDQGIVMVLIQMSDSETLGSGLPGVQNAGYVAPDGSIVWLLGESTPAPDENASPDEAPADEDPDAPAPDPGG